MSGITLSAGVRQNLLSLQNTADMMTSTQNKLSTGKKVNSALDNPTNFFTSSSLSARANDLSTLMDSMSNGVKTIEAADNGLSSITKTLESMQSTLRQARQDKSFEASSFNLATLDPNSGATQQLALSGGAFGGTTNVALTKTAAGDTSTMGAAYAAPAATQAAVASNGVDLGNAAAAAGTLNITYGGASVTINMAGGTNAADTATEITTKLAGTALQGKVTVAAVATTGVSITAGASEDAKFSVSGSSATSIFGAAPTNTRGSDGKLNFSVNGAAVEITSAAGNGDNLTNAVATANTQLKAAGSKFQAFNSGGNLAIRAITSDAGTLSIGGNDKDLFGASASTAGLKLNLTVDELVSNINSNATTKVAVKASNDNGKLRIQNLSTQDLNVGGANDSGEIIGSSTTSTTIAGNSVRSDLANQYNELRDQLDKLADDASFNGINLLARRPAQALTFNENGTSTSYIDPVQGRPTRPASQTPRRSASAHGTGGEFAGQRHQHRRPSCRPCIKSALTSVASRRPRHSATNLSVVQNRQDLHQRR